MQEPKFHFCSTVLGGNPFRNSPRRTLRFDQTFFSELRLFTLLVSKILPCSLLLDSRVLPWSYIRRLASFLAELLPTFNPFRPPSNQQSFTHTGKPVALQLQAELPGPNLRDSAWFHHSATPVATVEGHPERTERKRESTTPVDQSRERSVRREIQGPKLEDPSPKVTSLAQIKSHYNSRGLFY